MTRKPKRFLTAEQKYDVFVRIMSGQITRAEAAAELQVDRTVIAKVRSVARDGAIAALQASRPGKPRLAPGESGEVADLKADNARLQRRPRECVCHVGLSHR